MTVEEWLKNDNLFYHVTQSIKVESILKIGLFRGKENPFGICVIRSNHELIIEYLCQKMLYNSDEVDFTIIKIQPSKHKFLPKEIRADNTVEFTNPLHNYIKRTKLLIEDSDIDSTHRIQPMGILDYGLYESNLLELGLIEDMDY